MAPITHNPTELDHQALLDRLDMFRVHKPFRNPNWKPPQRRNKNVKQIIAEAQRKEASVMATQNNSGSSTPAAIAVGGTGNATPANGSTGSSSNIAQAAQNLSAMVLEKNGRAVAAAGGPAVTYTNIEAPPSLQVKRKYCDVTGLPAAYTDPKTRLRYHNAEVFGNIRLMGQSMTEGYLAARGAHTVLK
ncbi:YL1 nuclear [Lasiodiplodia theobromae]|uniref:Chromatin-remodeling complex subunit ies6 n=2 Tax=Lasiodiplodia TaxID=66739 RepID=A0A5N5DSC6_9PEZI|nr:Chromatin-remodeling complex subunit ies6 [Lasiodiplodia theobromae]KAB2579822.1 Chromatin-remodeling complex subunit ies6 [Lasiodiplodia theobromae]KAF4544996.1 Chromatin-remodeling complex subunit ies6 [Lasiodiplodia theobromae]KAF9631650.1 YL1 nuclear [Lasiodiplodia theobromae]KAK0662767.1 Chromatin-remodeling complex subunit ies6 [Lasiodiplodia hormozganensis]